MCDMWARGHWHKNIFQMYDTRGRGHTNQNISPMYDSLGCGGTRIFCKCMMLVREWGTTTIIFW